jgi:signal transduction histidine kinase
VMTNAAQHAPKGSVVRVSAEATGLDVTIRVADAGPGIPPEDVPHVFERFYRADRARSGGGTNAGSGIGLTIARDLVAANGGTIEVESTGTGGTTIRIGLPGAGG